MKSQCIEIEKNSIPKIKCLTLNLMHTNKCFEEKNVDHFYLGLHKNFVTSK
jgi:hypothetical protein